MDLSNLDRERERTEREVAWIDLIQSRRRRRWREESRFLGGQLLDAARRRNLFIQEERK
jgi:hypothetical protein